LKSLFPLSCLLAVTILSGCATTDDLRRVRGEMDYQLRQTNEKVTTLEEGSTGLKEQIAGLQREVSKTNQALTPLRGSQAEGRAELTEVREQIQQLRGALDTLKRDIANASARATRRDDEDKALKDRLDKLTFKVNFLENFLGIGKKEEGEGTPPEKAGTAAPKNGTAAKAKTDKEALYNAAYELFKEGKYAKSREAFEAFLAQYPSTEFSDNAHFWIAECYYFDKQYEKAILEYEKVIKNFPEGNKVPNALLKQGLSFLKLGDKTSAKLLLQQVTKDYPNTSQARIARQNLLQIK
jgi:tol-pal system protein YbgF